ncbi:MAG TPA: response regulator transcription factor, partial [Saprospiraceae bacterium]|nr:response regulator transcription factor [Saprospiraceae bacterium]
LILSMHESEEYVMKALDFGADGYILKDTSKDHFLKAIRSVAGGGKYFSGAVSEYIVARLLNTPSKNASNSSESPNDVGPTSIEIDELTKRERQILDLVTDGLSNKEIADKLNKSVRTIEAHRFNLMKKLDAKNLAELIFKAGKKS